MSEPLERTCKAIQHLEEETPRADGEYLEPCSPIASRAAVQQLFAEQQHNLSWLALCLTAHEGMAAACVIDACATSEREGGIPETFLEIWARHATIRSAVELTRSNVRRLTPAYEHVDCPHGAHPCLTTDGIALLQSQEMTEQVLRLDSLCRSALILCGVEGYSIQHGALTLGVSKPTLASAYCAALMRLDELMIAATTSSEDSVSRTA